MAAWLKAGVALVQPDTLSAIPGQPLAQPHAQPHPPPPGLTCGAWMRSTPRRPERSAARQRQPRCARCAVPAAAAPRAAAPPLQMALRQRRQRRRQLPPRARAKPATGAAGRRRAAGTLLACRAEGGGRGNKGQRNEETGRWRRDLQETASIGSGGGKSRQAAVLAPVQHRQPAPSVPGPLQPKPPHLYAQHLLQHLSDNSALLGAAQPLAQHSETVLCQLLVAHRAASSPSAHCKREGEGESRRTRPFVTEDQEAAQQASGVAADACAPPSQQPHLNRSRGVIKPWRPANTAEAARRRCSSRCTVTSFAA